MTHQIRLLYEHYLRHPVVTTDSRRCTPGSIFFALRGARFDGNRYAADVLRQGCALAVVDDPAVVPAGGDGRYFLVDNVLDTLQRLAAHHREQFRLWQRPVAVVGITGTNGKTTTKELLHAVLSRRYSVLATEGNLNNDIGVPLTLLRVTPDHELAIVEMGANHPLDIAALCAMVHPDYGLITTVGKAHLEGFGSLGGVVAAKTKLYDSLREDGGTAFVDAGNALLTPHAKGLHTVPYAVRGPEAEAAACRVTGEATACSPCLSLTLCVGAERVRVATHLIGAYNLINVIAAAAVGHHFGVPAAAIKAALEAYTPSNMRSQLVELGHGRQLILDAYNANPTSMRAALESFNLHTAPHRSLVLGAMGELGAESAAEHLAVLRYLMQPDVTLGDVLLVGRDFEEAFAALTPDEVMLLAGRRSVRCYADADAVCRDEEVLRRLPGTVLIKGSRAQRLERVAERIAELSQVPAPQ